MGPEAARTHGLRREFLLDTTVLIAYLRGFSLAVSWVNGMLKRPELVGTTPVNLAEIELGKKAADAAQTDAFLDKLYVYPIGSNAGRLAGEWMLQYQARGVTLRLADCLIAGVAADQGLIVVTHNVKDFVMLPTEQILVPW